MSVIKSSKFNGQQDFEKSINRSIYPENTTWPYIMHYLAFAWSKRSTIIKEQANDIGLYSKVIFAAHQKKIDHETEIFLFS